MMKSRPIRKSVMVATLLAALLLAGGCLYVFKIRTQAMKPVSMQADLPFAAVYPTNKSGVQLRDESGQYFPGEQLAVFEGEHRDSRSRLVFSQQPLPDELKTGDGFDSMIASMMPYGSFHSKFGQVNLTRPPSQGERQSAVFKTESSLVFILANEDLTDDQWRELISSLVLESN